MDSTTVDPRTIYHLISRFVAREWFIKTAGHRQAYSTLLARGLELTDWRCFSFAIMSNHVHLGLVAGTMPLADWLREVHGPFAELINEQRDRIGAVFARGPNLREVRADGVGRLISYLHRNPVRAGVAERAVDSDWTSHRAYARLAPPPPWLDVTLGTRLAGYQSPEDLAAWIDAVAIERSDLDAVTLPPDESGGFDQIDDDWGPTPAADESGGFDQGQDLPRASVGVLPVQRLNARENADASAKPTASAISRIA